MTVRLASISVYPVKSLSGVSPACARAEAAGLAGDRRWTVVDADGTFLTQRQHPRMALLSAVPVEDGGVRLEAPGVSGLSVAVPRAGAVVPVRVWQDLVPGRVASDEAGAWLGAALGVPCRLVWMHDAGARRADPAFVPAGSAGADGVSFADGFPVLLASVASLGDLNLRLAAPVGMERFRPNLVVEGGLSPWAEDGWVRVRIGDATFRVVKPCDRCVVTTIDPRTGTRPDPREPLRTLARFRRGRSGGVMFGQNLVTEVAGTVSVGDAVEVLATGVPNVAPPSDQAGRVGSGV